MCNDIKLYGWGLKNIAKIDQERPKCGLFQFFFQQQFNDSNENFDNHFTLYGGPMCAMRSTS